MVTIPTAVGGMMLGMALALTPASAAAGNIAVTRVALVNQDTGGKTIDVQFDLGWSNSWRGNTPTCTNWDAAWVFVKFRAPGSNNWEHAKLSRTRNDHAAPDGIIDVGSDGAEGMGVFIYSASVRTGEVTYAGTRLRWKYGANGYSFAKGAAVEVSVHAIEMVYVPQGPFYLGSGGTEAGHFYRYTDGSQCTNPFLVSAEAADIAVGKNNGSLCYAPGGKAGDGAGPIPASFPKGFAAFYCMKYEISQGQYVDFLNKLTRAQQATRTAGLVAGNFAMSASAAIYRISAIRCPGVIPDAPASIVLGCDANANMVFNEPRDGMDLLCNCLSWADGIAYADWAALRPMTELEYEKACRGPAYPAPNEYARGGHGSPDASYWGIMAMGGNGEERPVTVGNAAGRAFTGIHGDGKPTKTGGANAAAMNWPTGTDAVGTDDAVGAGFRGGDWHNGARCVSERGRAAEVDARRDIRYGWRGVRSAP